MLKKDPPIITQQTFNQSIILVWNTITKCNLMQQWFFESMPSFDAKVGFKTQFNVSSNTRDFLHLWTVVEVIPLKKITCNWKYQNIEGDSNVTFELNETKLGTNLTVTCEILEDFPENISEFKTESCIAGWNYFINERLKNFLSKTS